MSTIGSQSMSREKTGLQLICRKCEEIQASFYTVFARWRCLQVGAKAIFVDRVGVGAKASIDLDD